MTLSIIIIFFFCLQKTYQRNGAQEPERTLRRPRTQDPIRTRTLGGPRTFDPFEDPGSYEDQGPYEDEFFDDPGKTQEPINSPKFLDFHIMFFIWWNLQLKADRFIYHC